MSRTNSSTLYRRLALDHGHKAIETLKSIIPEEEIEAMCRQAGHVYRKRLFTPYLTLCGLLIQALDEKKSQSNAVINLMHQLHAAGLRSGSHDPSAFCAARQRLPENILPSLVRRTGNELEREVPADSNVYGRPVKLVDGTTVSMPDTPENREHFGCASNKKEDCGMPLARITGIFSLGSGAVLDYEIDPYRVSENQQWRQLQQNLSSRDILVGDCLYGSYADIAALRQRRIHGIFRLHQTRKVPKGDWTQRVVTWVRRKRPAGMSIKEYRALPKKMKVRLIRVSQVDADTKCRKEVIIVTTLMNKHLYPAELIVKLYGARWEVEVDFRHIKSTLKMDVLSGNKPRTVKLEIDAHLLAYNLLRTVMWRAGIRHQVNPLRLSVERARQEVVAWYKVWGHHPGQGHSLLLRAVASHKIPHRPGRLEPRAVKRRRDKYPLMKKPRRILQEELIMSA